MTTTTVVIADCVEHMRSMPEGSIDAVVCDPPYGLEFMGKEWDRLADEQLDLLAASGDRNEAA